jgi:hypothetical protein
MTVNYRSFFNYLNPICGWCSVIYLQIMVLEVSTKVNLATGLQLEILLHLLEWSNHLEGAKADNSTKFLSVFLPCVSSSCSYNTNSCYQKSVE